MRKTALRLSVIALFVIIIPIVAISWGNEGHMAINKVAVEKLPADMPAFMKANAAHISYMGPEPDRWREKMESALKYSQEPDHFMDMELVDWMTKLPPDRYLFYRAVYEHRAADPKWATDQTYPEKIGLLPYATQEMYDRLKVSFREYRKAQKEGRSTADAEATALHYAGWLGHYVGDAANPLHTTIKYNGWVGENPNGYDTSHTIHWRMEGPFVGRMLENAKFDDLVTAPKKLDHPFDDFVAYMRDSQSHVEEAYKLEKACGWEGEGTKESREFIRHRLAAGAQMLANMIYTAWVESAVEPPPYRGDRTEVKKCEPAKAEQAK